MTRIHIEECPVSDSFNATISFDHGQKYPIMISDPFTEEEERLLEWYFEHHLRFPLANQIKAKRAAGLITTYGEALFKQVFADPDAYKAFEECVRAGIYTVQIEIAGSPRFHSLHWEALKDPQLPFPVALEAPIVRTALKPLAAGRLITSSPTINVLVVTARPLSKLDVGYRTVSRPLIENVRQRNLPVRVDLLRPGTYKALANHLREASERHGAAYYHVIHFDVHGALLSWSEMNQYYQQERYGRSAIRQYDGVKAFLFLEGELENTADLVEAGELATLLISHHIPIVILNACQSGKQIGASETSLGSLLMQAGIWQVLAMGYSVTVSAAELFMRHLYTELIANRELSPAINSARRELYNHKGRRAYFNQIVDLEDWLLPVVYQDQPLHLAVRPFTQAEAKNFYGQQTRRYSPPQPTYEFVGRDLDILQIEKRLLIKRNLILIRGMGGMGKTTLLQHLGVWWQTTGFVKQIWYFGYDERAWSRQHILSAIAQQLLDPDQYIGEFVPLSVDAQQVMITKRLRAERHLLILDNLESITGTHLAIQHSLSPDEQVALGNLLADLAGGHTLILLGSRENEEWLAEATFVDNVYELSGLDPEAASRLTNLILERHGVGKYRQDNSLLKLLRILNGHPLALEIVLANLTRQTPTEVLSALQLGDMALDSGDSQKKTESILRCIDYSFGNLSPEAQQLLICFAPFTSVIDYDTLAHYIALLKLQPALHSLPFESWPEVVREAMNRGLLSRHPNVSGILHLDPILPYFLRTRLYNSEQAEVRHAIETAFYQHYRAIGNEMYSLFVSKNPRSQRMGQMITRLENENLSTALEWALANQAPVRDLYNALMESLYVVSRDHSSIQLSEAVLSRIRASTNQTQEQEFNPEVFIVMLETAIRKYELGQNAEAKELYQQVLDAIPRLDGISEDRRKSMQAHMLSLLGEVAYAQREWNQAEQYYQQGLQILIDLGNPEQVEIYYKLGLLAGELQHWSQASQYYQQALKLFTDLNDREGQADTYSQLGIVALDQHLWSEAAQYFLQSLPIYIDFNNFHSLAKTYLHLGVIAWGQDQWALAEQYYLNALQIFINFNDLSEQAKIYTNLGEVEVKREQWAQAEQYYLKALSILIDLNDYYSQAKNYFGLGTIAQEQKQSAQAEQYYLKALSILVDFNDLSLLGHTYDKLGLLAQERGKVEQAEQHFLKALSIFIDSDDRSGQVRAFLDLGLLAVEQRQWSQAEQYYLKTLPILTDRDDHFELAMIYYQLGNIALAQGQLTQAEQRYLKALPLFIDSNQRAQQAKIYFDLGLLAQEQDQWIQAEQYYLKALPIFIDLDDFSEQAGVYRNLGTIGKKQDQWIQAEQNYLKALQIYVDLNDHYAQGEIYNELGIVARYQDQWIQAQQYFQRALQIFISLNDQASLARTYLNLGAANTEQDQRVQAEQYYLEALSIFNDLNDYSRQARVYLDLGTLAKEQRQWDQAEQYYLKALQVCIDLDDHILQGETYRELGKMAQDQGKWSQAEEYYHLTLPIFIDLEDHSSLAESYLSLCQVNTERAQWAQAEQYCQQALPIFIDLDKRRSLAVTYQELGNIAQGLSQWIRAEDYFQLALQIYTELGDRRAQAYIYDGLGSIASNQSEWIQAEEYYQHALQVYTELDDRYAPALTFMLLGDMAERQNRLTQAEQYYRRALQVFIEFGDRYGQATVDLMLGRLASNQGRPVEGQNHFLQAFNIFVAYRDKHYQSIALQGLAYLWQTIDNEDLLASIAFILNATLDDVKILLGEILKNETNDQDR